MERVLFAIILFMQSSFTKKRDNIVKALNEKLMEEETHRDRNWDVRSYYNGKQITGFKN